jgi:hypothetical protein
MTGSTRIPLVAVAVPPIRIRFVTRVARLVLIRQGYSSAAGNRGGDCQQDGLKKDEYYTLLK